MARKTKESSTSIEVPQYYLSFEGAGYYLLNEQIDAYSTGELIRYIVERNVNLEGQNTEIKLIINSNGGDLTSAFALIDVMKGSKIPISTFGLGTIASAALNIFLAGTKGRRFITPNTSILSHQYSWGNVGKEHELYALNKELQLTTTRMVNHYKKCTGMSEKDIKNILLPPHDVWLSAEEAIKYGIADKIVTWY